MTQEYEALAAKMERISKEQSRERGDMMFLGHPDPWLAESSAAIRALVAENERLREALEPFSEIARLDVSDSEADSDLHNPNGIGRHNLAPHIAIGDLRRARKALEPRHD